VNENYDVLFLGGLFPKEIEKQIYMKSKNSIQNAANKLQWSIVNGLDSILDKPVKILNMLFLGSYPKNYQDSFIKSFRFSHAAGAQDFNVGFINITVVKEIFRTLALKKPLISWIHEKRNEKKIVIIYSVQSLWLDAAKVVKKLNPNIHICIIVPDLPNYISMSKDRYFINRLYKKHCIEKCNKYIKYMNSFVFLTESMNSYFNNKKPYVVIEGIAENSNNNKENYIKKYSNDDKVILYTGTLTRKYGVIDLVRGFMLIEHKDYKLIICGEGETKQEIIDYSALDKRITYLGLLETEEIINLQNSATVLINPRKNTEEYTKYSFPSKILEYLTSGTPVIAYKLDGVPDEYDEYIYYIDGNRLEDISSKIIEVCNKSADERQRFGRRARKFVLEEKNGNIQAKKIIEMIKLSK